MISSIELNGFKSFVNDEIIFGNLTILTGLNSSGKSSIIQAIQLLEKAASKQLVYLAGHGALSESKNPYIKDSLSVRIVNEDSSYLEIGDSEFMNISSNFTLPRVIHIAADRLGPESSVSIDPTSFALGKKGENIFNCIAHYQDFEVPGPVRHPKAQGDTFEFNLEAWLGIISPNIKFKANVDHKSDSSYGTFNEHRAKNVGFGLSYALPIITALLVGSLDPQNSLVMLENPEAHLHPRGQTEMAKLICLCVESGVQVIVETHSDHLFDRVRLFAKESQTNFHSRLQTYWLELDENGNTDPQQVQINHDGRVKKWPIGMFDQFSINSSKLL